MKALRRSERKFGFCIPIIVDKNYRVIAGAARLQAAKEEGFREVPVVRLEHLTDAEALAFSIADNRLAEHSSWDEKLLGELLHELSCQNLSFDLSVTGFTDAEIDLKIEVAMNSSIATMEQADSLPDAGPLVTQLGDCWCLGRHRLLCGSATEEGSFEVLMEGKKAAMVFTDPPYNVPIPGHASGNGKIQHKDFAMASGEMSSKEFIEFLQKSLGHAAGFCEEGSRQLRPRVEVRFSIEPWKSITQLVLVFT